MLAARGSRLAAGRLVAARPGATRLIDDVEVLVEAWSTDRSFFPFPPDPAMIAARKSGAG
jgi:hypothetical protein